MEELKLEDKKVIKIIKYFDDLTDLGFLKSNPVGLTDKGKEKVKDINFDEIELTAEEIISFIVSMDVFHQEEAPLIAMIVDMLNREGREAVKNKLKEFREKNGD